MLLLAYLFRAIVFLVPGASLRWLLNQFFPCKTIIHQSPYLSRWILWERADGGASVLHYFHRSDSEEELHNHPWEGHGIILAWGYADEHRREDGSVEDRLFGFGARTKIMPSTFHRARLLRPDKGSWSYFSMGPRGEEWSFWDRHTGAYEPWQVAVKRRRLAPPIQTKPWWCRE